MNNKFCDRCGKKLGNADYCKTFSFGFKEITLELCPDCYPIINKRHKDIQNKYKGKLLKIYRKFYNKLLK